MLWNPSYYYVFEPGDFVPLFQHWFLFLFSVVCFVNILLR